MTDDFDPYLIWLGIRSEGAAPDYYQLLGLTQFESNEDVIASAADRQMKHVRTFQAGKHAALSQRILNELAAAKLCLLKPETKWAYDENLRAAAKIRKAAPNGLGTARGTAARPRAPAAPLAVAVPLSESELDLESAVTRRKRPLKRSASKLPLLIGGAAILLSGGILLVLRQPNAEDAVATRGKVAIKQSVAAQTSAERATVKPATSGTKTKPAVQQAPEVIRQSAGPTAPNKLRPGKVKPENRGNDPKKNPSDETETPDDPSKVQPLPLLPNTQPVSPESRAAAPSAEHQKQALKNLKDIFAKEYAAATSSERRLALAELLHEQGLDTRDDPASQYVLFDQARDLAIRSGGSSLALKAIDELGNRFLFDARQARCDALLEVGKWVRGAAASQEWIEDLVSIADESAADERYDLAVRLAQGASTAAAKSKNRELMKQIAGQLKALQEAQKACDAGQKAAERLAADPDDPEANLRRGLYLCLRKEDWPGGMQLLARSGDETLARLAREELARPIDSGDHAKLGDGWFAYRKTAKGLEKQLATLRANYWYTLAAPNLAGLQKLSVDKRREQVVRESGTLLAGDEWISKDAKYVPSSVAENWSPLPTLLTEGGPLHLNWFAFHTVGEPGAHITIDLGRVATITRIEIQNTLYGPALHRAAGMSVWFSSLANARGRQVWTTPTGLPSWNVTLAAPKRARYITIGLPETGSHPLHLSKVKVFGRK